MKDGERKYLETAYQAYLKVLYNEAKIEADAHYQALYRCFLDGVPPELRRTGEFAPTKTRPYGFNASSTAYRFGLNLGVDYAQAWAIFRFKTRPPHWELVYYDIWLSVTPMYTEQARSKTLSGAILSAKEMWLEHQKRLTDAQQGMPTGQRAIQ